jgi:hypothetical protein
MKQKPPQIPMAGVKELAERIAKEMDAEYPRQDWTKALWDADFATRLIAAYTDGQEPVAWDGSEGWEQLAWNLCAEEGGEESCTELLWDGGPIPEPWGDRWLKYEGEAKRMISLVRKFTAPPAPRPSYTGTCANLHETVQVPNAACAAPSSEEVRDAVARLNDRFYDLDEGDCRRISDLIEYLAARVPDGCVVVPKEPTNEMIDAPRGFTQIIRGMNGCTFAQARAHCVNRGDNMLLWPEWARAEQGYVSEAAAALFIYQLMIAAGEVKP